MGRFAKGHVPWNKNKVGLQSASAGSFVAGHAAWNKGKTYRQNKPSQIKRSRTAGSFRKGHIGYKGNTRPNRTSFAKGHPLIGGGFTGHIAWNKGKKCPQTGAALKRYYREHPETPEAKTRRTRAAARALAQSQSPNKLERRVLAALIDAFPEQGWKFNNSLVIAGKIPDFIRSDGATVVGDVHGDYWHRHETRKDVQTRQRRFRDAGYQLVIIWEREFLRTPRILDQRLRRAMRKCGWNGA